MSRKQSKQIPQHYDSLHIYKYVDNNNARISNIGNPLYQNDAATKDYVDNNIITSGLTNGNGILISSGSINVLSSLTHVNQLGTINTGTWSANTINIPYGGTGRTSINANKLVIGNGTNPLVSVDNLTYENDIFSINCGVNINNTNNSIGIASGGSLTILGGASITKTLYIGENMILTNNSTIGGNLLINGNLTSSNITVGNININGNLTLNNVISTNALHTNTTLTNLITSNITCGQFVATSGITTGQFVSTNMTTNTLLGITTNSIIINSTNGNFLRTTLANTIINNGTISNLFTINTSTSNLYTVSLNTTNITVNNVIASGLNTLNLNVSNSSTLSNINTNNITVGNLISNSISTGSLSNTNIFTTNLSSNNLNVSFITSGSIYNTNFYNTNISNSSLNTINLSSSNITVNNIIIDIITTGSLISNNTHIINNTTTNIYNTSLTTGNVIGLNLTIGNINTNNITTTNTSIGTLNVLNTISENNTCNNIQSTNITCSNVIVSNIINTNLTNTNTSVGTLHSTSISNSNLYTTNISTNSIRSSFGIFNSITSTFFSNGNFYTYNGVLSNISNNNLISSTISSGNINTNIGIINSMTSTVLSTGTLYNTNSTISNSFINNISSTNILNTVISSGNIYISNSNITNKKLILGSDYSGSSGTLLNIIPNIFTDTVSVASSSNLLLSSNTITPQTIIASNNVITEKATSLYIQSNPVAGTNNTFNHNSALSIGYVDNSTGGYLSGQIMFERNDGNWYSSIYNENATNKLVIANGSLSGGGGIGLYTYTDTPIIFSHIPSATNVAPTNFITFTKTITNFLSTETSVSTSTGSVVFSGGVGINKHLSVNTISKNSGTFDIPHPILNDKRLIHSFIEGPRCDIIYRGFTFLINGLVSVNLNTECVSDPECAMTNGTFEALCSNPQYFLQPTSFIKLIGNIENGILNIISDSNSNEKIFWMVIAERKDNSVKIWDKTNSNGYLITEHDV